MVQDFVLEESTCAVCGSANRVEIASGADYLHHTTEQKFTYFQCSDCSHLYLNPRPVIDEVARLYPSDYLAYDESLSRQDSPLLFIKNTVFKKRFKALADLLPSSPRILEIGCGDLVLLSLIRRNFLDAKLCGLDIYFSPHTQEVATHADIETLLGTIETARLEPGLYDLIIMNQLIEHVWDVDKVLANCFSALKPGGYLSIETPNPNGWDRRFFQRGAWGGYYWPRHLNLFSKKNLKRVVSKNRFQVVRTNKLLSPYSWIYSLQFWAQRKGIKGVDKLIPDDSVIFLGVFAAFDVIGKMLGLETSNQKLIARK